MSKITFSAAGVHKIGGPFTEAAPVDDNFQTKFSFGAFVTVGNNEVLTIEHGEDPYLRRTVKVISSAGADAIVGGSVTVLRTTSTETELTFGAGAAGDYVIHIEWA